MIRVCESKTDKQLVSVCHHSHVSALATGVVLAASVAFAQSDIPLKVTDPQHNASVEFSLADLDALPQTHFITSTIWTDGEIEFSGPSLKSVLEAAGADGETVSMTALNDYAVEMPLSEVSVSYPIIATRLNGETMSIRDKGPYWVVFPYDLDVAYQTEVTHARSVWQLSTLNIVD